MRVASKLTINLGDKARKEERITGIIDSVHILDKGTGSYTLQFHFLEESIDPLTLDQDEINDGDSYLWSILRLSITHAKQAGKSLKIIVEKEI